MALSPDPARAPFSDRTAGPAPAADPESKAPLDADEIRVWRAIADWARNKRRYIRHAVDLRVRFLTAAGEEDEGRVRGISVGGAAIECLNCPDIGVPVVLYIDRVGRLEGMVVRHLSHELAEQALGFAVQFHASPARTERIVEKLMVLINEDPQPEGERRLTQRAQPQDRPAVLTLPDGRTVSCRVIDMSLTGVSVESDERPSVGSTVAIGRTKGRVVRHHDRGFAITLF